MGVRMTAADIWSRSGWGGTAAGAEPAPNATRPSPRRGPSIYPVAATFR